MFREMRRKEKQLSEEAVKEILQKGHYGILSVYGEDGYPYGVPINYGYTDGKLYLHSNSRASHKCEAIEKNPNVCFTVVDHADLVKEHYDCYYASVIVFGKARVLRDDPEKTAAMHKMMRGIAPEYESLADAHCHGRETAYVVIEITPDHITGKEGK